MSKINPLEHPICFAAPLRIAPSAWITHVPFGMFLVDLIRPSTIVELGTHYGVSYCSFCQAVKELKLETQAYAVDTWLGDEHNGFYSSIVLEDLKKHHDPRYGTFSQLIQSTFDNAVSRFEDGAIDLLHIDGYHTYEAVKHDFKTWLPKLSSEGVVLFHDVEVRDKDFGVWKLWDELSALYPSFSFVHGHGLGLLAVGKEPAKSLDRLLNMKGSELTEFRDFFFRLGEAVQTEQVVETLSLQLAEKEQSLQELTAQVQAMALHADGLTTQLTQKEKIADELTVKLTQKEQTLWEITNSRLWKLMLVFRKIRVLAFPKNSLQIRAVRFMLSMIRRVASIFRSAALFINKGYSYVRKNGLKESFLTIQYRARKRQAAIKLDSAARISLQNILERLGYSIKSEQVLTALVNMLGRQKTSRVMMNIVEVEKFIFSKNNGEVHPIVHASQLPIPLHEEHKKNILFIASEFPSPHHGGGNRVLNFIKTISLNNNIYLCTAFIPTEHEPILAGLAPYCRGILKIPYGRFGGNQEEIRNWLDATNIDIVHYEWPRSLENYSADFGRLQIFTFMEAVSLRLLMDMELLTPLSEVWLEKLEQLAYAMWLEFVQASKVDARIAVTEKDAKFFENLYPFQEYAVLNHGLDFEEFTLPDIDAEPYTLVFVGNYLHYPNAQALEFFFNEIWENIRREMPQARIYVVGANPTEALLHRSDGEHVIVTGMVADVRPYIQKASVCIAPLISGAGLRGKVIEYAALRRPFVATSIAATDLLFKDGVDYFCADTAVQFSDKIITLLKDPQLAHRMAETAYVTARENYDNQHLTGFLLSYYEYLENSHHVK